MEQENSLIPEEEIKNPEILETSCRWKQGRRKR